MKIFSFLLIGLLTLSVTACGKKSPPESLEIMNPPPVPPATEPAVPETTESQPKKEGIFEKAGRKMDEGLKKAGEKTEQGLQKAGEGIEKGLNKTGEKIKETTD
jgi:hypothetical protein